MAASAHVKTQTQQPKPKRRKRRETTISTSASSDKRDPPTVVSTESAWCCAVSAPSKPSPPPPPLPPPPPPPPTRTRTPALPESEPVSVTVTVNSPSPSPFTIRVSPGRTSPVMDSTSSSSAYAPYPASYTKFNTALNAGLLNPMSPPPPVPLDKTRSSPTLFEMMANEQDCHLRNPIPSAAAHPPAGRTPASTQDRQLLLQERVMEILGSCSPGNQFNDPVSSDVRLTLSSKDGLTVSLNVHRPILTAHSRSFATRLKQQRTPLPYPIEIPDCDDIEVYMETLRLMYCKDIRKRLMKEGVPKVLAILKVSAAIGFDAGVLSCLEYLEAAPWAEDEEEKVAALLSQLHLESAGEVLKRVSVEVPVAEEGNEEVLLRLLQVVLQGKDEKARRDMKGLVSKMLRENASAQSDLSKESLYSACNGCLGLLRSNFLAVANEAVGFGDVGQIARQADNLHWILDIMIDRQIADEFLKSWAGQAELSEVHSKVPAIHRYEVSRVTARLFVGIGKGQILVSKETRCLLLRTWLEPFYDDFGWMRRACKGLDRHLIEDGLSNTILTLPLSWQQDILLSWFDRFLNSGEDCPNIQRAFEVWWRRAFWRRSGEAELPRQLRIVTTCENS